ncbi:Dehydrogenase [Aphelenchoides besseyi]|nr:Dehydrogenase [Aphelenchoides besseyi]
MLTACIFYGVLVSTWYLFWYLLDKLTISSIEKKSVFITGCDSGFGNLTVFKCLKHGMTVFAGCLTEEGKRKLEEKATRERLPGRLHAIRLDVSSDESVSEAVKYVQSVIGENGQLHGLVNNAGVAGTNMWDDWTELDDYRHCFEINTLGLIRVTHAFKPFIKRARGRIVNTASICGRVALPCLAPYTISKYGVEAYSDTIRAELALYKVRVSIVEPGFFSTALTSAECQSKKLDEKWEKLNDDIKKEYGKHMVEFSKSTASQQLHLLCSSDLYLVANAYFHALTGRYSRRRYKVGNDSVYFFVPFSFLPGLLQDSFYSLIATLTKMPKPAIFQQQ